MSDSAPNTARAKPRVVLFAYWFPPCQAWPTAAARSERIAVALAHHGWQPTVVAPVLDDVTCGCASCSTGAAAPPLEGIDVIRVRVTQRRIHRWWRRWRHRRRGADESSSQGDQGSRSWLSDALAALVEVRTTWVRAAREEGERLLGEPDSRTWVWTTVGPIESIRVGDDLRDRAAGWIVDLRDPLSLPADPSWMARHVRRGQRRLRRRQLRRADIIVAASDQAARVDSEWLDCPILPAMTGIHPDSDLSDSDLDTNGRLTVGYFGRLYPGWLELDTVCLGIALLPEATRARIRLHYVGPTPDAARAAAARAGIEHVVEIDAAVSAIEARSRMAWEDVLLLQEPLGDGSRMPGKVFDYLASGRPVLVVPGEGPAGRLVRARGLGATASTPADVAETLAAWVATRPAPTSIGAREDLRTTRTIQPVVETMRASIVESEDG